MIRALIFLAIIVVAGVALAHAPSMSSFSFPSWPGQGITARSEGSYHFPAQGTLQISDASGDITVTGTDSNSETMDITVTKHASSNAELNELVPRVGETSAGVVIESDYPSMCNDCDISYSIRMPRDARVAVNDDSGDVRVRGTTGIITIEEASGDVHLEDDSGPVSVDVDSGDSTLSDVTGALRVVSSSGDIDASGLASSIDLGTSSGDVTANYARTDDVKTVHLHSDSGSLKLVIPKDIGAKISATTADGSLDSDFLPVHSDDSGGDTIVTIGNGNATVDLSTDSGDITINGR